MATLIQLDIEVRRISVFTQLTGMLAMGDIELGDERLSCVTFGGNTQAS